jgi:hypothetical protein
MKPTLEMFYDQDSGVWANNFGSFLNRGELGVEAFDADEVFIGMFADEDAACDAILARWEARSNGGGPQAKASEDGGLPDEVSAAPDPPELTLFGNAHGALTKQFALDADGILVNFGRSVPNRYRATVCR